MSITLSVTINDGGSGDARVAPRLIKFSAKNTTSSETTKPFRDLIYYWDFGDTDTTSTWPTHGGVMPARLRNRFKGPVAAHVYETAGTYTWRCWALNPVTDTIVSTSGSVTILSPDSVYPTTNTICFANSGQDFVGAPSAASQITTASFNTAMSSAGNWKRLLFRRGGTYSITSIPSAANFTGLSIGSFGSGADPIINLSASTRLMTVTDSIGLRIYDLDVHGQSNASTECITSGKATDLLILRVDCQDLDSGLGGFVFEETGVGKLSDLVGIVDCNCIHLGGGGAGANWVFAYCANMCILGCRFEDSTGREHVCRLQHSPDSVIAYCHFKDPATGRGCLTVRGPIWTGSGNGTVPAGTYQEYINVYSCLAEGSNAGLFGSGSSADNQDQRIRHEVWDSCIGLVKIDINLAASFKLDYVVVRNCAIIMIGDPLIGNLNGFFFGHNSNAREPGHVGARFYNCTVVGATATKTIYGVQIGGEVAVVTGVTVAAASTTITLDTDASAVLNVYAGKKIRIFEGTGGSPAQERTILSGTTGRVQTIDSAWTTIPDTTSRYQIIDNSVSDCEIKKCHVQNTGGGPRNVFVQTFSAPAPTVADSLATNVNSFATSPPAMAADLAINSGSVAHDAGGTEVVANKDDIFGNERPVGNWDIGASEYGAQPYFPTQAPPAGAYLALKVGSGHLVMSR
jgi:hypothetical protein